MAYLKNMTHICTLLIRREAIQQFKLSKQVNDAIRSIKRMLYYAYMRDDYFIIAFGFYFIGGIYYSNKDYTLAKKYYIQMVII